MRRLPDGGRVDRATTLHFTFDGVEHVGHPGDTMASALLAAGVTRVATSVRLGRPRGVVTAWVDEPSAVVGVTAPYTEPMVTATTVPLVDGLVAHGVGGRGTLPTTPDDSRYDAMHVHCEVLVVGAGPAGLAAALTAARAGVRTVLVDDRPEPGGSLLAPDADVADWVAGAVAELRAAPHVRVLARTTAFGTYDNGLVLAVQDRTAHLATAPAGSVRQRVWRIRTAKLVLATGAHERPIAFAGNDRPGVLLAASAREYLHRYGVLVGDRVVVFTTDDSAYDTAHDLTVAGAHVTVVDARPAAPVVAGGPDVRTDTVVSAVLGGDHVTGVRLAGRVTGADAGTLDCDAVLVCGGWNPAAHLYSQAGGRLAWDAARAALVPSTPVPDVRVAGSAAGAVGTTEVQADGVAVVIAALGELGVPAAAPDLPVPPPGPARTAPTTLWSVPLPEGTEDTRFVDLQRDATVADVLRATGAGLRSVEHVKRYTTIGTAHDQGKTSGVLSSGIVAEALGREPGDIGTTTFRPPYTPVAFATLAGRNRGELFDPVRTTALHDWHVGHGAVFENVGQWHRPQYYPRPGEDADAAVLRETTAARTGVGIMDASTLGKIDVRGADAGVFLDRIYTNVMSSLKPGRARYGVMCGLDGMVLDDGTVMRVGEREFVLTTTTGNAAAILEWMEEFAQTEWPDLDVWLTSVTEHWVTAAVVGPRSRDVLAAIAPGLDVSAEAFAFMQWHEAEVAGVPARVARISFSGELAYEVNVPAWHGPAVWSALIAAGEPHGITPYGTDAMHVLRAEKGYPIIGQDTDGTVTPHDLGLGWAVSKKKPDFVGRRSFARAENVRADRKQLVGLLPRDPGVLLDEGGQVLAADGVDTVPVPMLGHVTSSYRSAALGSTFALALVRSGRERIGQQLSVYFDGRTVPVIVTDPVLFDKEGTRRDG